MIVTHRHITRREKTRRRFRYWWQHRALPADRLAHLMRCAGCVGCASIIAEMVHYVNEVRHDG